MAPNNYVGIELPRIKRPFYKISPLPPLPSLQFFFFLAVTYININYRTVCTLVQPCYLYPRTYIHTYISTFLTPEGQCS